MKTIIQILIMVFIITGCNSEPDSSVEELIGNVDSIENEDGATPPVGPEAKPFIVGQLNSLAVGKYHACAVNTDLFNEDYGKVKCWGKDTDGNLGSGESGNKGESFGDMGVNLEYAKLGPGLQLAGIYTGGTHSCAIFTTGKVKCWGSNSQGQLGLGHSNNIGLDSEELGDNLPFVNLGVDRTAKELALGIEHTCALLDNNKVKCWGSNQMGQLGLGKDKVEIPHFGKEGQNPSDLSPLYFGEGRSVKKIVSGNSSVSNCAILDDNSLTCWGYNREGMLGLGLNPSVLGKDTIGDAPSEMGQIVNLGEDRYPIKVTINHDSMCALLDTYQVKCWGVGPVLGYEDENNRGHTPESMQNLNTVKFDGTGENAKDITSGPLHTCVITENDTVNCWGLNYQGNLGHEGETGFLNYFGNKLGDMGANLDQLSVNLGTGITPERIFGGGDFTCVKFTNGNIKCWGSNTNGKLGLGDTINRGDNAADMGDDLLPIDLGF